jgi:hypothetical protein
LPGAILEAAYWWGLEWRSGRAAGAAVRDAAAELKRLDAELGACAARMQTLLVQRADLRERHGLHSDWGHPGLNLLDLVREAVARRPEFAARVWRPLDEFVRAGHVTSVPSPSLADVLTLVLEGGAGPVKAVHADDQASLVLPTGSAKDGKAASVRRFLAAVDELAVFDEFGRELRPIEWLTGGGIGLLLSIVSGHDPESGPFNARQIGNLRTRFLRERVQPDRVKAQAARGGAGEVVP